MRNCFFFVTTVMLAAAAGSVACSDDESSSSPLQPSPLATAPAGADPQGLPAAQVRLASGAGDTPEGGYGLQAGSRDGFNAYNAQIEYVDGEVTITFAPVEMPDMPNAAREYRNRAVTVWRCPVEPHHIGQRCGAPVFEDSFAFAGSPSRTFMLPDCAGWLVMEAAELSDDRSDGWRNAPLACRQDEEGRTVTSVDTDGNGPGWSDSRFPPPPPEPAPAETAETVRSTVQKTVDATISDAGGLVAGRGQLDVVDVINLFENTEGTDGDDYRATSSDVTVATVEITSNPKVRVTPVGPGTATIQVIFLETGERREFSVTVSEPAPAPEPAAPEPPAIPPLPDRMYEQGETIEAFSIAVTDPDDDTVTVTVTGLPDGLTWSSESGMVSGTVAADAPARAYTVTVTANDGTTTPATATFTITVTPPPPPAWRSLRAADLHVLDRRTSGFPAPPTGSRIELSSFSAWAIRGMPGHVLFEWSVSRGSLAPAPRTWRDCRIGIRFDDSDDYNRYHLKAGWFETGVARPLPAPYGPSDSVENPPFLDIWNTSGTVLRALADLRPDTLVNAAFVKRAGATAPPDATMVSFDGFCNNYVLSENAEGQLVIQPGDAQDGSDHRSQYWAGPKSPYPITFPSS